MRFTESLVERVETLSEDLLLPGLASLDGSSVAGIL